MAGSIWKNYWNGKISGGHRYCEESFLRSEANEKLLLLDGGDSILDFGCGAGELLLYYASHYSTITGVDFSESMLLRAETILKSNNLFHCDLVNCDDGNLWNVVKSNFDRITATAVIQYLTEDEIIEFCQNSIRHLNKKGKIVFFDVIDPRRYLLWKGGFYDDKNRGFFFHVAKVVLAYFYFRFKSLFPKNSSFVDMIGYKYDKIFFEKIAKKFQLKVEYANSFYYEYRYHVILSTYPE